MARPSETIKKFIDGTFDPAYAEDWELSWFSFYAHKYACSVLAGGTKEERARRLSAVPEKVRPIVEAEARKLWRYRNDKSKKTNRT